MALIDDVILEDIRENQRLLDSCKRHHFPTLPTITLGLKLNCSKCGGSLCALQAGAYTRGYVAAGGNGNDIIPGWD